MTLPISISNPCRERWDKMTPVGDGTRLCARCERRVTDFRGMSDYEIALAHALGDGRVCGVYDASQLRGGEAPPPRPRSGLVTLALGATLLSGTAAAQATGADAHPTTQPADAPSRPQRAEVAPHEAASPAVEDSFIVRGTVKDARGEVLPGVSVLVDNSPYRARTDSVGRYTLKIRGEIPLPTMLRLRFASLGYHSQIVEVSTSAADAHVDVTLGVSVLTMEGIVVPAPRRTWLSRAIRAI
jgi:hypothetical protein